MKTIKQVPGFRDYAGSGDAVYGAIRLGDQVVKEWQAVMSEAQAGGFFQAALVIRNGQEMILNDWLKRDGSHMLYIYTLGGLNEDDHKIIGWSDNECADFGSLAEFINVAQNWID